MKKLIIFFLAVCVVLALGANTFATSQPTNGGGHVYVSGNERTAHGFSVDVTDNFLYCNPFAWITVTEVKKAVLEGDGAKQGNVEGSAFATGYIKFKLSCNCPVIVAPTVPAEFTPTGINLMREHHERYMHERGQSLKLPVKFSWNGSDFSGSAPGSISASNGDSAGETYDCWTYDNQKLWFRVVAPTDNVGGVWNQSSIDDVHAGNYTGTITLTVLPNTARSEEPLDDGNIRGGYTLNHNGITCVY